MLYSPRCYGGGGNCAFIARGATVEGKIVLYSPRCYGGGGNCAL